MSEPIMVRQAEQDIRQLCQHGLDSVSLRRAVMQRLRRVVPFDGCCWGTIDPGTLLITSEVSEGIPNFAFAPVTENEYLIDDVNKFSRLARGNSPVGILSQSTGGAPMQSPRFRAVLARAGFAHELRAAFVTDQSCWGVSPCCETKGHKILQSQKVAFWRAYQHLWQKGSNGQWWWIGRA